MKLTDLPVSGLIAAFGSTSPTPGGGSASALAGAAGAALLAMVAAMPKNRASTADDASLLQAAGTRCGARSEALLDLVNRDSEAYDAVVAAYRLPKASDDEKAARKTGIQAAMKKAAETPLETMRQVIEQEPKRPSSINQRVDRDLQTICLKCLQKNIAHRYASAEALAEDLERWLRQEPIRARRSSVWERAGKWEIGGRI